MVTRMIVEVDGMVGYDLRSIIRVLSDCAYGQITKEMALDKIGDVIDRVRSHSVFEVNDAVAGQYKECLSDLYYTFDEADTVTVTGEYGGRL
jgi:CheY-specific phosphatase CheX